jgi:hypothetical protein
MIWNTWRAPPKAGPVRASPDNPAIVLGLDGQIMGS